MDCHKTQQNLIFYIENELDVTKSAEISQHLQQCTDCHDLYVQMASTLEILPKLKQENPNPFLYTRIESQLDAPETKGIRFQPAFKRIVSGVTLTFLLLVAITAGFFIGSSAVGTQTDQTSQTNPTDQMTTLASEYQLSMSSEDLNEIYYLTEE